MSILKVARMGHPVLRERARPLDLDRGPAVDVPEVDRRHDRDHERRIRAASPRPQVHEGVRLFVAGVEGSGDNLKIVPFINPVITPIGEETVEDWEGCLSIPGHPRQGAPRARSSIKALDRRGKPFESDAEEPSRASCSTRPIISTACCSSIA